MLVLLLFIYLVLIFGEAIDTNINDSIEKKHFDEAAFNVMK